MRYTANVRLAFNPIFRFEFYIFLRFIAMGAFESDINKLGRWFDENVSSVCRDHYLKGCPIFAALAMAGVPRNGFYRLDRSTVLDIGNLKKVREDVSFSKILEYLAPGLLSKAELAEIAVERPAELKVDRDIPASLTNFHFLKCKIYLYHSRLCIILYHVLNFHWF